MCCRVVTLHQTLAFLLFLPKMLDYTSITYLNICDGSASIATDAIYCYDFNYLMKRNFDSEYFAKGAYRLAFRGTIYGEGPRDGTI